jgi:ADP-dependent NAD(P)H-hydrate dehydratase / NAD(P)H-hydrate epimerase
MLRPIDDVAGYKALLDDKRFSVLALGPGLGLDIHARGMVEAAGAAGRQLVLDADALTLFADTPEVLFERARAAPAAVLTPHTG